MSYEYTLVKRKVSDLKPDPNQPRKSFDEEKIKELAQTYKTQGIINPIEIDKNDIIVTGEMRWRAAKLANIEGDIECKLLKELNEKDRFKRQMIENLQHNLFTKTDRDQGIIKMWETGDYKNQQELADMIGLSQFTISNIFRAHKIQIEHNLNPGLISSRSLAPLDKLTKTDQKKVINKILNNEVDKRDMDKVVSEINKLPNDVKTEILKPKIKITREKIEEAKEIAKLPNDVREEVLKTESEITLKEAKEIAEFPKQEERQNIVKQIKQTKQASKQIIEQKKDISKGKTDGPITMEDLDYKLINIWDKLRINVKTKFRRGFLNSYSETTRNECYKIIKDIITFLRTEFLGEEEVKEIGS